MNDVAWFVPMCGSCSWRGVPCRTTVEIEAEPVECPRCGAGLGAVIVAGSWRTFTRSRAAGLRERR
jgi:hypothetical protein